MFRFLGRAQEVLVHCYKSYIKVHELITKNLWRLLIVDTSSCKKNVLHYVLIIQWS